MYFLIQSNIYSDPDHDKIFNILERLGLEHESINLNADMNIIETKEKRNDVFVYGSVKLARLAKKNTHWTPGSFYGGNHLFEIYSKYYKDNLINYNYEVFKFDQVTDWQAHEEKFIKPYKDAKIFTGKVFNKNSWSDFVEEALINPKTPMLTKTSLVQVSIPTTIIKEARIWIIGEQIIDSVYYKFNGDIPFEGQVASEGIAFAKEMIKLFNVADAFVMDIGYTSNGWKIVEINCINSSGFYPNSNVESVFRALHLYFSNK